MSDKTIVFQKCICATPVESLYTATVAGQDRFVRVWHQHLPNPIGQRLLYAYSMEEDLPKVYESIHAGNEQAFVMQRIPGIPITRLQSSLSPKVVYDIVSHILGILEHSHLELSSLDSILLTPKGNLLIVAPSIEQPSQRHNGVWLLAWWALQRLSALDTQPAQQYFRNQKETEYTTELKRVLSRLELGLPNQEWLNSAIQTLRHMCAFHKKQRWTATNALKMMEAYAQQAIGLELSQFCAQHARIFQEPKWSKGPKSGEVHPIKPWILKDQSSDVPTAFIAQLKEIWKSKPQQRTLLSLSALTMLVCHSITAAAFWMVSPQDTQARPSDTPMDEISVTIQHDGVRKITLESVSDSSRTFDLTRSKRILETSVAPGPYQLKVKHKGKTLSLRLELDSDTRIDCQQAPQATPTVQCTKNNRTISWD